MDDTEFQTPIPWGLVEHVQRTKSGRTTMQISLSIETRARMALAASQLNVSKLCLIRAIINRFLLDHEKARQGPPPVTSEAPAPVTGHVLVGSPSGTVLVPVIRAPREPEDNKDEEPGPSHRNPVPEPALEVPIPIKRRGGRSRTSATPR